MLDTPVYSGIRLGDTFSSISADHIPGFRGPVRLTGNSINVGYYLGIEIPVWRLALNLEAARIFNGKVTVTGQDASETIGATSVLGMFAGIRAFF